VRTDSAADAASALAAAWQLQQSGNFVAAFDLAQEALHQWPDSQPLQHVSILALASCGSTQAALAALRASTLAGTENEDFLAIEARLLKDLAFKSSAPGAQALLAAAAEAYERIAQRTGGNYTGQNAALLWMLAGADARATRLASAVAANLKRLGTPADAQAAYFHWATIAEAALVLGDRTMLEEAVASANPLCRTNLWARARTFAQMRRLLRSRPDFTDIVERWYRPSVGLVLTREQTLRLPASTATETCDVPALAYAVGADQENDWQHLPAQGIRLHVIFANAPADEKPAPLAQVAVSRQASGHNTDYTWSSLLLDGDDDTQRGCAETALGLSLGHADAMQAPWAVLHRADGRWRQYQGGDRANLGAGFAPDTDRRDRTRFGFLFADAVGYSNLSAGDTRRYWTKLLPEAAAAVLRRHSDTVLLRKTWGDAIHAVFRTASAAAKAALEMNAATARLAEELEFGRRLAFRIAVHFGTADHNFDPIEEAPTFFGPQLSFAARIVPVAPPGGVFVTEPCAAQLSLERASDIDCAYIGTTSLAKGYGRVRLLTLESRT
jgi:Adenylate and Guanylate cyclase catalytic domain